MGPQGLDVSPGRALKPEWPWQVAFAMRTCKGACFIGVGEWD